MAENLGYSYSHDQIESFAKAASFDNMRGNASQFAPQANTGFWKSDSGFFHQGHNSEWSQTFTAEQLTAFHERVKQLLNEDQAAWLLH
jgi:hypothetical protein